MGTRGLGGRSAIRWRESLALGGVHRLCDCVADVEGLGEDGARWGFGEEVGEGE